MTTTVEIEKMLGGDGLDELIASLSPNEYEWSPIGDNTLAYANWCRRRALEKGLFYDNVWNAFHDEVFRRWRDEVRGAASAAPVWE